MISPPFKWLDKSYQNIDKEVFISITSADISDDKKCRDLFWEYSSKVVKYLKNQDGIIAYDIRRDLIGNKKAQTYTVWKDKKSIKKFIDTSIHQKAIKYGYCGMKHLTLVRSKKVNAKNLPLSWKEIENIIAQNK